jgi:phage-related protein
MMLKELYSGGAFTLYAMQREDGACPIEDYIDEAERRSKSDHRRLLALLEYTAANGPPRNREKSNHLEGEIYELKSYQDRIAFIYDGRRRIVLIHAIQKKSNKWPKKDVDQVKRLVAEYRTAERRG